MADEQSLNDLVQALAEERGLDLRGYKHTSLERRVRRRMQQLGVESFTNYLEYVRNTPGEPGDLLNTVLINVTRFFRDPHAWDALARDVLPVLFRNKLPGTSFRVWCAGCATGEEAYSVAILLFELLGSRIREFEIKIYATDNDEHALSVARRAEYRPEALRGVRPEIKARYFTGEKILRVVREVRRLVIFGRSNILSDAPISHVDLLVCRNLLIYFDPPAQAYIMARFRYALNEGGVLFLGKSESQLKRNSDFAPINARWRIFQRRLKSDGPEWPESLKESAMAPETEEKRQELERLKLFYDTILDTLEPGVLVLNSGDVVITDNDKILKLWGLSSGLAGRKLQETELWQRCPDLQQYLQESRQSAPRTIRFECNAPSSTVITVTIRPIISQSGSGQVGTLVYMENVTSRVTLQNTIEELETTAEELQSTNEELETTNEELQSTNEELETTNEELQSTNEELETTNEELQSLNEELETTNEELSSRTRELDELNARYSEMIERMPWPVFLVNGDTRIYMFNSAAQKFFGFAAPSDQGMRLEQLPLDNRTRQSILRRLRQVVQTGRESRLLGCHIVTNRFEGDADVRFTPLASEGSGHGVIVMFEVGRQTKALPAAASGNSAKRHAKKAKSSGHTRSRRKSSRKK
ncbi:MAG TPA: CheR family methyltransferase [Terriglobales bacterium]|nr:CheR family methyltransferase [Terriglobales bacterium]